MRRHLPLALALLLVAGGQITGGTGRYAGATGAIASTSDGRQLKVTLELR